MEKTVDSDEFLEFSDETLESFSVRAFLAEMAAFTLTGWTAVRGYGPNKKGLETIRDYWTPLLHQKENERRTQRREGL